MEGAAYDVEGSGRGHVNLCKGKTRHNGAKKRIVKRPASCFPAPKRGKRRMYARPQSFAQRNIQLFGRKLFTFATATPIAIVSIERCGRGT